MCEVLRELDLPPAVFWVATTIQYVLKIGMYLPTIHPFNMAMDWYIVRCNHCTGDFNHVIGSSALQLLLLVGGTNIYEIGMLCTRVSRSSFLVLEKKSPNVFGL